MVVAPDGAAVPVLDGGGADICLQVVDNPTIQNITVQNCKWGLYGEQGTVTLTGVRFRQHQTAVKGGGSLGMTLQDCDIALDDVRADDGIEFMASGAMTVSGGAIHDGHDQTAIIAYGAPGATIQLSHVAFTNNKIAVHIARDLHTVIDHCTIDVGTADPSAYNMWVADRETSLVMTNSSVKGGSLVTAGTTTITGGSITGVPTRAGILVNGGSFKMRGVTVSGNQIGMTVNAAGTYDLGTSADPGQNTIQGNSTVGIVLQYDDAIVHASGNTWNPNKQNADASGHYASTTLSTKTNLVVGNNYAITMNAQLHL